MSEMRVMVLGAGGPAADNYIKSLRLADPDIYVLGVDTHPLMLELSCASETVCIDTRPSDDDTSAHAGTIYDLAKQHDISMIHAQPDQEVEFLAEYIDVFEDLVSLPGGNTVRACRDKLKTAELLGDHLAPRSTTLDGDWQGEPLLWMRARTGAGSFAATRVSTLEEIDAWRRVWAGKVDDDEWMLSTYLPDEDRSYTGVWWRGEPVASACRVRVEYADTRTPSGQCSSPRIAKLDSRPETFDVAEAAIRRGSEATGTVPHGVFYVDMREAADGRLLVTEINAGRFNTTQNFYTEAGLNLPYVHASLHHSQGASHGRSLSVGPDAIYVLDGTLRLLREDDVFWVRQPDMGHKLVVKTRAMAGVEEVVDVVTWTKSGSEGVALRSAKRRGGGIDSRQLDELFRADPHVEIE